MIDPQGAHKHKLPGGCISEGYKYVEQGQKNGNEVITVAHHANDRRHDRCDSTCAISRPSPT
jgi:hypothetical protein